MSFLAVMSSSLNIPLYKISIKECVAADTTFAFVEIKNIGFDMGYKKVPQVLASIRLTFLDGT